MAQNLGDVDRTARLLLGGTLAILTWPIRAIPGTVGDVIGLLAVYLLATGVLGWDPFYMVLRVNTRSPNDVRPPPPKAE